MFDILCSPENLKCNNNCRRPAQKTFIRNVTQYANLNFWSFPCSIHGFSLFVNPRWNVINRFHFLEMHLTSSKKKGAFQARDPGSIPGQRIFIIFSQKLIGIEKKKKKIEKVNRTTLTLTSKWSTNYVPSREQQNRWDLRVAVFSEAPGSRCHTPTTTHKIHTRM